MSDAGAMSKILHAMPPTCGLNVGDIVTYHMPQPWPWLVRAAAKVCGVKLPVREMPPAEYRITSVVSSQ